MCPHLEDNNADVNRGMIKMLIIYGDVNGVHFNVSTP